MSNSPKNQHFQDAADKSVSILLMAKTLKGFRDYLQQHNWTSQADGQGLNGDDLTKFNNGNQLITSGYNSAQKHCDQLTDVTQNLQSVVNAAYTYTESFTSIYEGLFEAMKAYQANPGDADNKEGVIELANMIISALETFQQGVQSAKDNYNNLHNELNADVAKITEGLEAFEGLNGGVALDVKNLSQATLRKQLTDRIDDLNGKIHKLELECGFETAGAVLTGVVGPAIAISNFWNPIGWAAGVATVVGEVFMGLDLKKKYDELHQDQEELKVSNDEKNLLQPLFTIKKTVANIKSVNNMVDDLADALNLCSDDFKDLIADVKKNETHFEKKKYFFLVVDKNIISKKYADLEKKLGKLADMDFPTVAKNKLTIKPLPSTVSA